MKPKLKALAVSIALAATSVSAGAVIPTGGSGKLVPTSVATGDLRPVGVAWNLGFSTGPFSSGSPPSPAKAAPDTEVASFLLPTAYSPAAMHGVAEPTRVPSTGGIGAIAAVTRGTSAGPVLARMPAESQAADGRGSARLLPEVGNPVEETFSSPPERLLSDATALSVPEPGNWAVLLAGLLGVGAIARRRMSS